MAIAVQSISTAGFTSGTSIAVNKPTGLAVGDLMISFFTGISGGLVGVPSGFNTITNVGGTFYAFYKIADSGDVAASTFTFTSNNSGTLFASISRITGHTNLVSTYLSGSGTATNTATPSVAAGLTPNSRGNNLLIMHWDSFSNATNLSNYAIATSNPTWTEGYDVDNGDTSTGMAYAVRPQTTATGNVSVSGGDGTTDWAVILVSIAPSLEATLTETITGTDSKLTTVGAMAYETITSSDTLQADDMIQWTNQDKNNSSWINQDKI